MAKTTVTYWNDLDKWKYIEGTNNLIEQLTLAKGPSNGDYTRLTRFKDGADTKELGTKSHDHPEEILIVKGRLYDEAFGRWLEAGDYASRLPGELHGPFRTDGE